MYNVYCRGACQHGFLFTWVDTNGMLAKRNKDVHRDVVFFLLLSKCTWYTQSQIEHLDVFLWCLIFTSFAISLDADGDQVEAMSCSGSRKIFGVFCMYFIQYYFFIYRRSYSTLSPDPGIEPRTVATLALAVGGSNHSARSHPSVVLVLYCGA